MLSKAASRVTKRDDWYGQTGREYYSSFKALKLEASYTSSLRSHTLVAEGLIR